MDYLPNTIYTTLNDVFNDDTSSLKNEDYNYIKLKNNKKNNKQINKNKKLKEQEDIKKDRYINKELIKSWIQAVQSSKFINLYF